MLIFESQREARGQTRKLLLAFALTVLLLLLAVNAALALAWGLTWRFWVPGAGYPQYFFEVNTGVTLLFVLGGWWVETSRLSGGGKAVAEQMGARLAQPGSDFDEQRFANIVDEMAVSSGLQRPLAMVLARDAGINAFAAGWNEQDAVVAVTRGALQLLSREELQGLVAHEFSHIVEGDTRLNMRLMGMVFGLEMLFRMGQQLAEPDAQERRSAGALLGFAIMAAGWLGWVAGLRCRQRSRVSVNCWQTLGPCSGLAVAMVSGVSCGKSWGSRKQVLLTGRWVRRCSTCCWRAVKMAAWHIGLSPILLWNCACAASMAAPWGRSNPNGLSGPIPLTAIRPERSDPRTWRRLAGHWAETFSWNYPW